VLHRLLAVFLLIILPLDSYAGASVSHTAKFEILNQYVEVNAGQLKGIPLSVRVGDHLKVHAQVLNQKKYNDIDLFVCTERDLQLFQAGRQSNCQGANRWRGEFSYTYDINSNAPYYLLINNSFSLILKKKLNVDVTVTRDFEENFRTQLEQGLTTWNDQIIQSFKVQPFDVSIAPCGTKNAYSESRTGNIRICTEMVFDLIRRDFTNAMDGVLYHELGHTLLNLWGLPGWNSEETVDEFAIVMLYWAGAQEKAMDWINFNLAADSVNEANLMLHQGSRHPLSIQRARNAKEILRNPGPVIQRWNKLLYPKMTRYGLKKILEIAPRYADKELIQELR